MVFFPPGCVLRGFPAATYPTARRELKIFKATGRIAAMAQQNIKTAGGWKSPLMWLFVLLVIIGLAAFIYGVISGQAQKAWQAYLINFLLCSGIAQGAVLFSTVMHMTHARWSGPLSGLAEAFASFFPISFLLFLLLFLGKIYLFPWLHEDLHGKEIWLNMPFLFTRDCIGLLLLYFLGYGYLYNALQLKFDPRQPHGALRRMIYTGWQQNHRQAQRLKARMSVWGGFYILAFALVLSLIGYDLIMSMDPHWVSTLFGAYNFVKAFYTGLAALVIATCILYLRQGQAGAITSSHLHGIGKLFFAFSLLWADFFYVQLVVIWYGNIPEETQYVIQRTMMAPWKSLAWAVFIVCFIFPFIVLLNKKMKARPIMMIIIAGMVIAGIWLEHLLLLGPALTPDAHRISLSALDGLISLGFLGLMLLVLTWFLRQFPELIRINERQVP